MKNFFFSFINFLFGFLIEKCKLGYFLFFGLVKCFFCLSGIYVFGFMNMICIFCFVGMIIIFFVVGGREECGSKFLF